MGTLVEAYHYSPVCIETEKDVFGVDKEPTDKGLLDGSAHKDASEQVQQPEF